jgi:dephospho-CoA kinase
VGTINRQLVPGPDDLIAGYGDRQATATELEHINISHQHKLTIGLTGGIASGKSLVAGYFEDLGVPVIDTDVIAREVVAPGMPALDEIQARFGAAVIAKDGSLDRQEMRRIVFSDDGKRQQLESILHPLIRESAARQADAAQGPYVIVVVPLLFESPMRESMDRILVVDCSEQTQLRRLTARDNEDVTSARRIIATQASREERLSIADDVITNDGSRDDTRNAVAALHNFYLSLDGN